MHPIINPRVAYAMPDGIRYHKEGRDMMRAHAMLEHYAKERDSYENTVADFKTHAPSIPAERVEALLMHTPIFKDNYGGKH